MDAHFPQQHGLLSRCGLVADRTSELFEEERAAIAGSIDQRRAEFSAGRVLAHELIAELGHPVTAIPRADRAPIWPPGLCGSISHSDCVVACVVAERGRYDALGIDTERVGRISDRVVPKLFTASETERLGADPLKQAIAFSAKESGFKATYPIGRTYIGFQEAEITIDLEAGTFRLFYLGNHEPNSVMNRASGYFVTHEHYVLTLVIIPQPQAD